MLLSTPVVPSLSLAAANGTTIVWGCIAVLARFVLQAEGTFLPDGTPAILFQVLDSGPGLGSRSYQKLFDPLGEYGAWAPSTSIMRWSRVLPLPSF